MRDKKIKCTFMYVMQWSGKPSPVFVPELMGGSCGACATRKGGVGNAGAPSRVVASVSSKYGKKAFAGQVTEKKPWLK